MVTGCNREIKPRRNMRELFFNRSLDYLSSAGYAVPDDFKSLIVFPGLVYLPRELQVPIRHKNRHLIGIEAVALYSPDFLADKKEERLNDLLLRRGNLLSPKSSEDNYYLAIPLLKPA